MVYHGKEKVGGLKSQLGLLGKREECTLWPQALRWRKVETFYHLRRNSKVLLSLTTGYLSNIWVIMSVISVSAKKLQVVQASIWLRLQYLSSGNANPCVNYSWFAIILNYLLYWFHYIVVKILINVYISQKRSLGKMQRADWNNSKFSGLGRILKNWCICECW